MIIFVGGLIGAGKSSVASAIAQRFSYHYHELDEIKRDIYSKYPEVEKCFAEGIPVDLSIRQQVFEQAAKELKELTKDHPNIVMDEVFHIRKFRHILFDTAKDLNQPFMFVWVYAAEQIIIDRLSSKKREGHVLDDPIPMHTAMAKEFDEFDRSVIYCANNGTIEDSVSSLFGLLENVSNIEQSAS